MMDSPKTLDDIEKLKNKMLAHLDGVYLISARDDGDKVVSDIICLWAAESKLSREYREKNFRLKTIMFNGAMILASLGFFLLGIMGVCS